MLTCTTLLAAVACGFDASVPGEIDGRVPHIRCSADDECPPSWRCRAALARCVPPELLDAELPRLTSSAVTPEIGGLDAVFSLSLSLTGALLEPPLVLVDVGWRSAAFTLDAADEAAGTYAFSYRADPADAQGARAITVRLVGAAGDAVEAAAGFVTLDFSPPVVVVAALSKRIGGAGGLVQAQLGFDEEVAQVSVHMAPAEAGAPAIDWQPDDVDDDDETSARFHYTPSGDEAEVEWRVRVAATDIAGNALATADVGLLLLDFTAPSVTEVLVDPPIARPRDMLRVQVTLSEPTENLPALAALDEGGVGFTLDQVAGDSAVLSFSRQVPDDAGGAHVLELGDLTDAAGNVRAIGTIGAFVVDGTPPALTEYAQSKSSALPADVVLVSFGVDEPLAEEPRVSYGGVRFPHEAASPDEAGLWHFSLVLAETAVEGTQPIVVDVIDVAGNRAVLSPGSITVDSSPPRVLAVAITPAVARLGVTAFLTVTANEPLGPAPGLTWADVPGDPGFAFVDGTGLGYTFSLPVSAGVPAGSYALEAVALEDAAGNAALVDLAAALGQTTGFVVDNVAPSVLAVSPDATRYSALPGFNLISVDVDVDDGGGAPAGTSVTLGTEPLSCGAFQPGSPSFSCSYLVGGDESEGAHPILVSVTDAAGNVGFASTSVELDFSGPEVVAGTETVQLVPAADNPIADATRATLGTLVRVGFSVDEPLAAGVAPTLESEQPAPLVFQRSGGLGGALLFEHTVSDPDLDEGEVELWATLTDTVGNAATRLVALPSPGLVVDVTPPPPPDVDTLERIRFSRVPWGAAATAGAVSMRVEGDAGATLGGTLLVYSAAAPPRLELGRATANSDGSFPPIELIPQDRAFVYVAEADEAGNTSSSRRVRDVEWVASLEQKLRGSTTENPHRVELRPYHTAGLPQIPSGELGAEDGIAAPGGGSARLEGRGRWISLTKQSAGRVQYVEAAYDSARSRVVVHGGSNGLGYTGMSAETWEWDGERWHLMAPTDPEGDGNPGAWSGHTSTYDPRRARTVLFGGWKGGNAPSADLWEWNGSSWERKPPGAPPGDGSPGVRDEHAAAWDPIAEVVLVDGGRDLDGITGGASFADTWAWDGSSWQELISHDEGALAAPGPRDAHFITWDGARLVMFTGDDVDFIAVWAWDGGAWTRLPIDDVVNAPSIGAVYGGVHVYDPTRGGVLLAARSSSGPSPMWLWDGARFEQLTPDPDGPAIEYQVPSAWDTARAELVVLSYTTTTWAYDGAGWRVLPACCAEEQPVPEARFMPSVATDPSLDGVVVYDQAYDDKPWLFSQGRFTQLPLADAGQRGQLLYDHASARLLLRPWTATTLFEWTGTTFASLALTNPGGEPQNPVTWAWDPGRGQIVLFGSTASTSTRPLDRAWAFTGSGWLEITVTDLDGDGAPAIRRYANVLDGELVTDEGRGVIVCYEGGYADDGITWEWDGEGWTKRTPADPENDGNPSAYGYFAMAYDPSSARTLLFGGWDYDDMIDELWSWDGTSWALLRPADPEGDGSVGVRTESGFALDPSSGRLLLVLGTDASELTESVWQWDSGAYARPSISFHVDTSSIGLPRRGAHGIKDVVVEAHAGGRGLSGGAEAVGVELLGWQGGRWQALASGGATVGAPAAVIGAISDAQTIADMRTGARGELHFAVAAAGRNETASAEVELDAIEARLRYRLPVEE